MDLSGVSSTDSGRMHDPSSFFVSSSPVQSDVVTAPDSAHLLRFLLAQMHSMQSRVDDLEGTRDLMAFQIEYLRNLSRMSLDQTSSLSGRVGLIAVRDDSSVAMAAETEEACSARANIVNDLPVSRPQRPSMWDHFPQKEWAYLEPAGVQGPSPRAVPASALVSSHVSLPYEIDYGAIGTRCPHTAMVTHSGQNAHPLGPSDSPDAVLNSTMASLEASMDDLLDDDEIKQGRPSAETSNPVSPPAGKEDSGVDSGTELQTSEMSQTKVKTFGTPAAVQAEKDGESSLLWIKSAGCQVLDFAARMIGPFFFGQSF